MNHVVPSFQIMPRGRCIEFWSKWMMGEMLLVNLRKALKFAEYYGWVISASSLSVSTEKPTFIVHSALGAVLKNANAINIARYRLTAKWIPVPNKLTILRTPTFLFLTRPLPISLLSAFLRFFTFHSIHLVLSWLVPIFIFNLSLLFHYMKMKYHFTKSNTKSHKTMYSLYILECCLQGEITCLMMCKLHSFLSGSCDELERKREGEWWTSELYSDYVTESD